MKNLSIASIIAKNQIQSDEAWLIALKIHVRDPETNSVVEVIRVVNNTEITSIQGEDYEPFPFSISINEKANELPTLTITIQDQTQIVQSYMQRYGGGVGFDVDLIIVRATTATDTEADPELTEYFQVISSGVSNYVVSWTLGAENPLRQIFPARRQEDEQCGFRFKDQNCGYTGPAGTCDLTLNGPNGCRAKWNSKNFGGYPGIIVRG
jgi:phage-related protein